MQRGKYAAKRFACEKIFWRIGLIRILFFIKNRLQMAKFHKNELRQLKPFQLLW
jgi:hypothetical protein